MRHYSDGAVIRPPRFQPPLPGFLPGRPYDPYSYGAQMAQRAGPSAPVMLMVKGVVIGFLLRSLLK